MAYLAAKNEFLPAETAPQPLLGSVSAASPCTAVCVIDPGTGWCLGCKRSLAEIANWGQWGEAQRRAVNAQLPARLLPLASR